MRKLMVLVLILFVFISLAPARADLHPVYPKVPVLITSYFAHKWSDQGAYRRVSKNGNRLGNFVALNFLPAGSIITIPSLFKTTQFEVADTLQGKGVGHFKGHRYWKVDILRDKNEWMDDFDRPQDLYIVKINRKGKFRDNYREFSSFGLSFTHEQKFPVLEYHLIGRPEKRWTRTPEHFRQDLEWLYQNNYYPMNLRDLLTGFKGLPTGKTPVVLTFDDSSSSQFRYLADGTIDPECAVGIIKAFHEKHPRDWPLRATFFVLVKTNNPDRDIFGQLERPDYKQKKLRQLTAWGMEVGSHMYSHERLSDITPKEARYAIARSSAKLKELSGQEIVSLAAPMGLYPSDEAVFSGNYQKIKYSIKLVCEVSGGPQVFPSSPDFKSYHIKRIQTIGSEWDKFFGRKE